MSTTPVIFIVGNAGKPGTPAGEAAYLDLMTGNPKWSIRAFWGSRLPAGTPLYVMRWDRDVAGEVIAKFAGVPPVIVGHSFGGSKAVEVAGQYGWPCKLILIDPVNHHRDGSKLAATPFNLSANVVSAVCYYRDHPAKAPYPSMIGTVAAPLLGSVSVRNVPYTPRPGQSDDGHGEYVWRQETIDAARAAL